MISPRWEPGFPAEMEAAVDDLARSIQRLIRAGLAP